MIGTASAHNESFLRELGVDEVIDYKTTRFEEVIHDLDVVFDTMGGETWQRSWQTFKKGECLASIIESSSPRSPPDIMHTAAMSSFNPVPRNWLRLPD